jgi:hypothetical protein
MHSSRLPYLCTIPAFSLDDFKRIFRVSCSTYDSIRNYLCGMIPFFHDGLDVTHRRRVCTDAKKKISLKYLAYGCSINAFQDYFQLGESTAMLCVRKFTSSIANSMVQKNFFLFLWQVIWNSWDDWVSRLLSFCMG